MRSEAIRGIAGVAAEGVTGRNSSIDSLARRVEEIDSFFKSLSENASDYGFVTIEDGSSVKLNTIINPHESVFFPHWTLHDYRTRAKFDLGQDLLLQVKIDGDRDKVGCDIEIRFEQGELSEGILIGKMIVALHEVREYPKKYSKVRKLITGAEFVERVVDGFEQLKSARQSDYFGLY